MKLNKKAFFASLIAGVLAGAVDILLFDVLVSFLPRPLLIGAMFVIFAVAVCGTLFAVMAITGEHDDEFLFLNGKGMVALGLAVCLLVLFGLGGILEFIYDLERNNSIPESTGYVFLLDESGSMYGNDPQELRYNAINDMMRKMSSDTPYAVYMFGDKTICVREMAPYSDGEFIADPNDSLSVGGSTYMKDGLVTIYDDIIGGKMDPYNNALSVVILTDGVSSDLNAESEAKALADQYKGINVRISAVGLGNVSEKILKILSENTGGVYVKVNNATNLVSGFASVSSALSGRTLLSYRNMLSGNALYMVLRVLFLTILAVAVAFMKAMACGKDYDTLRIIIIGLITGFVGAVVLETLVQLGLDRRTGQALFYLLLSITIVREQQVSTNLGNIPIYF